MARRKNDGMSVNLFPFLSILVCIIGCLTMIIVVINISQMNQAEGQTPEEVERAQEWQELKKKQEKDREELEKLKAETEELIEKNRETIAKRDKLQMLKSMLENQDEVEETRDELIKKFKELTNAVTKLDNDHPDIVKAIEEKKALLAKHDLPPEAPKQRLSPEGSGIGLVTRFIEATERGLYYHHSLTEDPKPIAGGLEKSEVFNNILKEVSSNGNYRITFLLRGDSAQAYKEAEKRIANFNYQNYGKPRFKDIIPGTIYLLNDGAVDLSMFKNSFASSQ